MHKMKILLYDNLYPGNLAWGWHSEILVRTESTNSPHAFKQEIPTQKANVFFWLQSFEPLKIRRKDILQY